MDLPPETLKALREEMIQRYGPFKYEAAEIDYDNLEVYNVKNSNAFQDSSAYHSYIKVTQKERHRQELMKQEWDERYQRLQEDRQREACPPSPVIRPSKKKKHPPKKKKKKSTNSSDSDSDTDALVALFADEAALQNLSTAPPTLESESTSAPPCENPQPQDLSADRNLTEDAPHKDNPSLQASEETNESVTEKK